jgi:hypothetical protein
MALTVLRDGYLTLNGVNLSAWVKSITVKDDVESADVTTMGATAKVEAPGLFAPGLSVTFKQDRANSAVDQTLAAIRGTSVAAVVRAASAAVAATNPQWAATVFVKSYSPISGSVGEYEDAQVEFGMASAWTRTTSA